MPHLHFEYSADLAEHVDLAAFAQHMRAAILATGLFPEAGTRVRGFAASCEAVADGAQSWLFLDMELRIGVGRSEAERRRIVRSLYSEARTWLEPRLEQRPFALSLELREIDPRFSEKAWNTIYDALSAE